MYKCKCRGAERTIRSYWCRLCWTTECKIALRNCLSHFLAKLRYLYSPTNAASSCLSAYILGQSQHSLESKNTMCLSHLFDLSSFDDTTKMAESMRKRAQLSTSEALALLFDSFLSGKSSYIFNFQWIQWQTFSVDNGLSMRSSVPPDKSKYNVL